MSHLVSVAAPRPLFREFRYRASEALPPGSRVVVPLGRREIVGVVTGADPGPPGPGDKDVLRRLPDPAPAVPKDLLELARRIADRTVCPIGLALKAMTPPGGPAGRVVQCARITAEGSHRLGQPDQGATPRLGADDRRILSLLAVSRGDTGVPLVRLRRELELSPTRSFRRLGREGLLTIFEARPEPDPEPAAPAPAPARNRRQQEAADRIGEALEARRFGAFLLEGVTGSGKTEVYLAAIAKARSQGRGALLLAPEIALAMRMAPLLRARFGDDVAVLHSGLTTAERRDAFWRVRLGRAPVALGARSAALAPIPDLGLVVVDEEHDGAYRQEEAPRYHARQVAWMRARAGNGVLVLGSATPSLETARAAAAGRIVRLHLPERVAGRPLPRVELLDMRPALRERLRGGGRGPLILAPPLVQALRETAAAGDQAMVLLNRRGYGGRLVCLRCGRVLECARCGLALTLHRRGHLALCHGCGFGEPTPQSCGFCEGDVLRSEGFGTERIQEELVRLLPGVPVGRFDRDATRTRGSHQDILGGFRDGRIRVLAGTQMLAKGHDFPAVTLVGVVAADAGLGTPDFRAAERTFQLLTQVAGRAGRGDRPGRVLIQAANPEHYAVAAAAAQDVRRFQEEETRMRRRFRYPPFVRLFGLTVAHPKREQAAKRIGALQQVLEERPEGGEVIGPAIAPGDQVGGLSRFRLLIKAEPGAVPALRRRIRGFLDVPELAGRLTFEEL